MKDRNIDGATDSDRQADRQTDRQTDRKAVMLYRRVFNHYAASKRRDWIK